MNEWTLPNSCDLQLHTEDRCRVYECVHTHARVCVIKKRALPRMYGIDIAWLRDFLHVKIWKVFAVKPVWIFDRYKKRVHLCCMGILKKREKCRNCIMCEVQSIWRDAMCNVFFSGLALRWLIRTMAIAVDRIQINNPILEFDQWKKQI